MKKNMFWKKLSLFSFIILIMSSLSSAYASNRESMMKLRIVKAYAENRGAECRNKARGRYLKQGRYYTIKTTLYRGNKYYIVGAGDSTVRDLDIVITDRYGNVYDRDRKRDALPIVVARAYSTKTFYVRVKMHRGHGYSNIAICYVDN